MNFAEGVFFEQGPARLRQCDLNGTAVALLPAPFDQAFSIQGFERLGHGALGRSHKIGEQAWRTARPVRPRDKAKRFPLRRVQPLRELKRMRNPA